MKTKYGTALLGLALLAACNRGSGALETDEQMASYAVGRDVGTSLKPASANLDLAAFRRGLEDVLGDRESPIADSLLQGALQRFATQVQERMNTERAELGEKNTTEGAAYMQTNGAREGVTTTASGLQYEVLTAGSGPRPALNDQVTIHYKGTLVDGTEFDSSLDGEPITFGVGGVIPGFSEALQLMPVGGKYRFVIPGQLAYGPNGSGEVIGPNATLVFEVELIAIPAPAAPVP